MTRMLRILRVSLLAPLLLASLLAQPALGAPGFHAAWVDQSPWPSLRPGGTVSYTIRFRNTGTQAWTKGVLGQEARLGINQDDAQWAPLAINWMSANRVATQTEPSVPPGANATFTFQVRAPQIAGTYSLHLRPVI